MKSIERIKLRITPTKKLIEPLLLQHSKIVESYRDNFKTSGKSVKFEVEIENYLAFKQFGFSKSIQSLFTENTLSSIDQSRKGDILNYWKENKMPYLWGLENEPKSLVVCSSVKEMNAEISFLNNYLDEVDAHYNNVLKIIALCKNRKIDDKSKALLLFIDSECINIMKNTEQAIAAIEESISLKHKGYPQFIKDVEKN